MTAPLITFDQRWRDRREYRLPPGETIAPREYGVDVIHERQAREFVAAHHYAGDGLPPVRLAVGLFRKTGVAPSHLAGVAVFSVGARGAIAKHAGLEESAGCDLGRFTCAPEVLYNGESWFLARALKTLRLEKPELRTVLSYADPLERRTATGQVIKPGHFGSAYQALNATFCGRGRGGPLYLTGAGRAIARRTLTKIPGHESGRPHALRQLAALGLETPAPGLELAEILERAIAAGTLSRIRHPGNFVYAFTLDDVARQAIKRRHPAPAPYPKKDRPAIERLAA